MPSNDPLPIRLTLTDQVTDCLRQRILSGAWNRLLPSEAELCREFGVSRGTLRRASAALIEDGTIISGGRGGRHKIAAHKSSRRSAALPARGKIVRILSPQPRLILTTQTQSIFQIMSESLGRSGLHLEFEYHPGLWRLKHPDTALRKITSQPDTAGWVLYRSTKEVQTWFAKSDIPAVVLGGMFPGIALSHAEFNLEASSRHAAGVFAARKHRRMVFLSVENATAGDHASAKAFIAAATAAGAWAELAIYDDTVAGLCHVLDGLLLGQPVPTAFFVAFPNHVPATVGHLTRRGFPVPTTAAVISRMDARLLSEAIPSVARYSMDGEALGRGMAQLLKRSIRAGIKTAERHCIIMPEFIDGETAGGPPPDWYRPRDKRLAGK